MKCLFIQCEYRPCYDKDQVPTIAESCRPRCTILIQSKTSVPLACKKVILVL